MKVKVECYKIKVKRKRVNEFKNLENFNNSDSDLFDIFKDFIEYYQNNLIERQGQNKVAYFEPYHQNSQYGYTQINTVNRVIKGRMVQGDYGYVSRFYRYNFEEPEFVRDTDHKEVIPYYFRIELPSNSNEGYLVLQRFGSYGVKTLFDYGLKNFFESKFEDYKIELHDLITRDVVNRYLETWDLRQITAQLKIGVEPSKNVNLITHPKAISDDRLNSFYLPVHSPSRSFRTF